MKVGGAGFVLFAKSQPDTPGKLTANEYSFEHLELASYELLLRAAERAGTPRRPRWPVASATGGEDGPAPRVARRRRDSLAEKDDDALEA